MDKVESQLHRAEEAQRILNSPLWEQAFADTRAAVFEAWAQLSSVENSEHAKDLHRMVKCLDKVKRCLEEHVSTGKLARKELEQRKVFGFKRA